MKKLYPVLSPLEGESESEGDKIKSFTLTLILSPQGRGNIENKGSKSDDGFD